MRNGHSEGFNPKNLTRSVILNEMKDLIFERFFDTLRFLGKARNDSFRTIY